MESGEGTQYTSSVLNSFVLVGIIHLLLLLPSFHAPLISPLNYLFANQVIHSPICYVISTHLSTRASIYSSTHILWLNAPARPGLVQVARIQR